MEELDKVVAFNNLLISLKEHPDADRFARGISPVSLIGRLLFYCVSYIPYPVVIINTNSWLRW